MLIAWYLLTTATQVIAPTRFPAPREVWDALRQIALAGYADVRLHAHILHSVKLVLMGFAVAVATGVPLGLAMGWSKRVDSGPPDLRMDVFNHYDRWLDLWIRSSLGWRIRPGFA